MSSKAKEIARAALAREFSDPAELQQRLDEMSSFIDRAEADGGGPDDPVRRVLSLCGDTWSALILMLLRTGRLRYSTLQRLTAVVVDQPVSQRMLTRSVRALEREGMIWRRVEPTVPPSTHYGLTPSGKELLDCLLRLVDWAEVTGPARAEARRRFDAQNGPSCEFDVD